MVGDVANKFKIPRDKISGTSHRDELRSFGAIPFIDLLLFCGFQNENAIHWNVAVVRRSRRIHHAISGRRIEKVAPVGTLGPATAIS